MTSDHHHKEEHTVGYVIFRMYKRAPSAAKYTTQTQHHKHHNVHNSLKLTVVEMPSDDINYLSSPCQILWK